MSDEHLPELHAELGKLGLLDPDAETEATRNLMVAPLAGLDPAESLDVRPIARAIADALAADERLHALPGKFGLLIDGGGAVSIAAERADVALLAVGAEIALGIDTPRERNGWAPRRRMLPRQPRSRRSARSSQQPAAQRAPACAAFRPPALRRSGRFWRRCCGRARWRCR